MHPIGLPSSLLPQASGFGIFKAKLDTKADTILEVVRGNVKSYRLLYSDDYLSFVSYLCLGEAGFCSGANPSTIRCDGRVRTGRWKAHVNGCEGEFSTFRPFMAVHRGVAKSSITYGSTWPKKKVLETIVKIK